mgnify:CR=1 FL=1
MPVIARLILRHPRRTLRVARAAARHRRLIAAGVVAWSALSVLGGAALMGAAMRLRRRRRVPAGRNGGTQSPVVATDLRSA